MLTRWSVQNFKSLSSTNLALSAINVFAGANSSGKSTIIQSMLLIKQTLQYAPSNRAIALNGPIIKLGGFGDVKNTFTPDEYIGIGWAVESPATWRNRSFVDVRGWGRPVVRGVEYECRWDVPIPHRANRGVATSDEVAKLQPKLLTTSVVAHRREADRKPSHMRIERMAASADAAALEGAETLEPPTFIGPRPMASYRLTEVDDLSRREMLQARADASFVGTLLSHFMPSQIGVQFDAGKDRAQRVIEAIFSEPSPFDDDDEWEGEVISYEVVTIIRTWLSLSFPERDLSPYFGDLYADEDGDVLISEVIQAFRYFRAQLSASVSEGTVAMDYGSVRERIIGVLYNGPEWAFDVEIPRSISQANDLTRSFFTSLVRYLGPLRDEPRHVYPLEALANPTDVGYRGEHTAAVLELNGEANIEYVSPANFDLPSARWGDKSRGKLINAVVEWLQYVGVARQVKTEERGVFGHQLQVKTNNDNNYHDLTNVGVGVSQVLPIIVSSLLAPAGSLLIFEQPELHLHPRVQARLADFFIAMKYLGKQCVLETHSEYLVDRLRLRIAQSESQDLRESVSIYFTQMSNGITECRPVEVTEFGAILDWPQDFFDQSQSEIEAIVRAARAKRSKRSGDDSVQ